MKNTALSGMPPDKNWSPTEIVARDEPETGSRLFEWWYGLTAVPEPPASASFSKRETARKIRLLSTVLFFFLPVMVLVEPTTFFIPNVMARFIAGGLLVASTASLMLNRVGKVTLAGSTLVAGFEIALTLVVLTTQPLDETGLQMYDLYIIGLLFAISLLPLYMVFCLAIGNSVFICLDLVYQPQTPALAKLLADGQYLPVLSRPIALEVIIAGVAFLWVSSATKAIARADRAEMIAKLEHTLADQKRELEEGIQQILQTHVSVANGNLNARAPLTEDNVLWQIARALNTLLVRLQRASLAEKELYRTEQAVHQLVCVIQEAEQRRQTPSVGFTQTAVDPLIAALQGKTLAYTQSPFLRQARLEKPLEPSSQ
jgi:hypothetical protein